MTISIFCLVSNMRIEASKTTWCTRRKKNNERPAEWDDKAIWRYLSYRPITDSFSLVERAPFPFANHDERSHFRVFLSFTRKWISEPSTITLIIITKKKPYREGRNKQQMLWTDHRVEVAHISILVTGRNMHKNGVDWPENKCRRDATLTWSTHTQKSSKRRMAAICLIFFR